MIKTYIKLALRNLWKTRSHSILNISGLAIAMTTSVLIMLWVQNEKRFDNYHPDADRIHLLVQYDTLSAEYNEAAPFPAYRAIKAAVPEIDLVAMAKQSNWDNAVFEVNGRRFREKNALYIDENWFKMFNHSVVSGSLKDAGRIPDQIVLTRSRAKDYFGDKPALEQTVYIDSIPFKVAAVVEDISANSSIRQDVFIPNRVLLATEKKRSQIDDWSHYSQMIFIKLSPSISITKTQNKITKVFWNNLRWGKPTDHSQLLPLVSLHFKQGLKGYITKPGNPQNIRIFTILAILLLVTASINFVNLSIAGIGSRTKEIGVRKIVGAEKNQLFGQIMIETVLTVGIALIGAIVLAIGVLPYFNQFTEKNFVFSLLNPSVFGLLIGTFLGVILMTGLYPAFLLISIRPISLFRGKALVGMSQQYLRKMLITGQLVLAVVMLVGVITIYRQVSFIQEQSKSYLKEHVLSFQALPSEERISAFDDKAVNRRLTYLGSLKNDLLSHSSIEAVSRVNGVSVVDDSWGGASRIIWDGYPKPEKGPDVVDLQIDADYINVANLTLVSGKWFDPTNTYQGNIILNETAVKTFGLKEPVVGSTFKEGDNNGKVIGVVKDFHHKSMHEKIDPVILKPHEGLGLGSGFLIKAASGRVKQTLADVESVWKSRYPNKPFEFTFLDEEFDRLYKDDQKALSFTMIFTGLSILISCMGLLGMAIISAQHRTKEIGVRKVLGASVAIILGLLSKDFVKLAVIAIMIASPIAWLIMSKWLESFAYRIDVSWWIFAIAGITVVGITLLTVGLQSVKAAMMNPVKSLRSE